jgi:dephospho-CoA kinase
MVFSNPEKRRLLENILHPEIRKLSEIRITEAAAAGHKRLIYMAPILIEAGADNRVDTIWVVTVRPGIQLERLMRRDDITSDQAQKIIASQMPLAEKERYGSVVIDNSGTETETWKTLESVWLQETGSNNG